jgi:uncharacterized protein (TIGR00369 family)
MADSNGSPVDFIHEPDPANPGWWTWDLTDPRRFNGHALGNLLVRPEGERSARLRLTPELRHANLLDSIHGGVILSLIDLSLFAAAQLVIGKHLVGAVTLDTACQFVGSGQFDKPLDAVAEVLRETGRLVFLRGLVVQEDHLVASFTGTIRKGARR